MAWANQHVFAAVAKLPDEALSAYIVNPKWTASRILQHIAGASTWFVQCLGVEPAQDIIRLRTAHDVEALAALLAEFDAKILQAADLPDEVLTVEGPNGQLRARRSTMLLEAVHHATEHRAQLVDALDCRGFSAINLEAIDLWAFEQFERADF